MLKSREERQPPEVPDGGITDYLEDLIENEQPIVLKINGQAEIQLADLGSKQRLLELVDRLETIEKVQQALESARQGKVTSLDAFIAAKKEKYGLRCESSALCTAQGAF